VGQKGSDERETHANISLRLFAIRKGQNVRNPFDEDVRDIVRAILGNIITLIIILIYLLHMLANKNMQAKFLLLY